MTDLYTTPNLTTLRDCDAPYTLLRLSVAPRSRLKLYVGHVDGDHARGARLVDLHDGTFYNGANAGSLLAGQLVVCSTGYGDRRVRLRSFTGSATDAQISIARNNLTLGNEHHVTIYRDYPLWGIRARIASNGTFYHDYDIAYTDENEYPRPLAVQGPDWAGELTGASIVATLDARASVAVAQGATLASYLWSAEPSTGCAIASATAAQTTATFTVAGVYWIKLQVTDSNGKVNYCRAQYHVHDPSYPWLACSGVRYGITWDGLAQPAEFNLAPGVATAAQVPGLARFVFWTQDYLKGVLSYQGGWSGRQMTKFNGYVMRDPFRLQPGQSLVKFQGELASNVLARIKNYSVPLEYAANPTKWYQYANGGITLAQALMFLLDEFSTATHVVPMVLPWGNTTRRKSLDDWEKASLYEQMRVLAEDHSIHAHVLCNEQGVLHVEPDAQLFPDDYAAGLTLVQGDWKDAVEVEHVIAPSVDAVHLSGLSFDGVHSKAIISKAPGDVIEDIGIDDVEVERCALDSQAQANELTGRRHAQETNEWPTVDMERMRASIAQSLALMVVPQKWHEWMPPDNERDAGWDANLDMLVRSVDVVYDDKGGVQKTVGFEPYADGPNGLTGDYPTEPPASDDYPPIDPPPLPPLPPVIPPTTTPKVAVAFDATNGCIVSLDALAAWAARNTGLTSPALVQGTVKRGWQALHGTSDPERCILVRCGVGSVQVSEDFGKTWLDRTPVGPPTNAWSDSPAPTVAGLTFCAVDTNNAVDGVVVVLARYKTAGGNWRGWLLRSIDLCLSWTWLALGSPSVVGGSSVFVMTQNNGLYTSSDFTYGATTPTWACVSDALANVDYFSVCDADPLEFQACMTTAGSVYVRRPTFYGDTDWHLVATKGDFATIVSAGLDVMASVVVNPVKAGHMYAIGCLYYPDRAYFFKSDDYGATWTGAYIGYGNNRYSRIAIDKQAGETIYILVNGGNKVVYSADEGATWNDKGNVSGAVASSVYIDPNDAGVSYAGIGNLASELGRADTLAGAYAEIDGASSYGFDSFERPWVPACDSNSLYLLPTMGHVVYTGNALDASPTFVDKGASPGGIGNDTITGSDVDPSSIMVGGAAASDHVVWASDDKGANWYAKGGADPITPGVTSIPNSAHVCKNGLYQVNPTDVGASICPLGLAVDFASGEHIYLTAWSDGRLALLRVDASGFVVSLRKTAGFAAQADVEAGTQTLMPRVVWTPDVASFEHIVLVYGAVGAAAYLAQSIDAGVTLTRHDTGLPASQRVTALIAPGDGAGGIANHYAFCSNSKVYKETAWTWDAGNALPFVAGAVSVAYDSTHVALIVNAAAGAAKAEVAPEPYTSWTDKTDSFPTSGATVAAQWVTP